MNRGEVYHLRGLCCRHRQDPVGYPRTSTALRSRQHRGVLTHPGTKKTTPRSAGCRHTRASRATRRRTNLPMPRPRGEPCRCRPQRLPAGTQSILYDQSLRRDQEPRDRPVDRGPCQTRAQVQPPPPGKDVRRKQLRRARKSVSGRYFQLMSGHAAIGPYLKDKIKKADDDKCWWCGGGKQQARHHLFTECRAWRPQIRRLNISRIRVLSRGYLPRV